MAPLMHAVLLALCFAAAIRLLPAAPVPRTGDVADERVPFILSHISTSTRYRDAVLAQGANLLRSLPKPPHETCKPVQLNLLARHGARDPTRKRAKQLQKVVAYLKAAAENLVQLDTAGQNSKQNGGADGPELAWSPPDWIQDYVVPWKGREPVGYLVAGGEQEMFDLAKRWKERMPDVLDHVYHPERYRIFGTQVPRASASAVAFGLGFLEGNGTLGAARHQAFAVISDTKDIDRRLRFHKTCPAYKAHKSARKPEVWSYQEPVYLATAANILARTGLNLAAKDVAGLWLMCKVEAALHNNTDQMCSLFNKEEMLQLEWADDVELHILKGYGAPINYRMAQALLEDILDSMEGAIADRRGGLSKVPELGRLRFAHAETIMPLLCTLGLFQESDQDFLLAAHEVSLPPPPPPPYPRAWRGSVVAPFGANTALVLYDCGDSGGTVEDAYQRKTMQDEDDDEEEEEKGSRVRYLLARAIALFRWGELRPRGAHLRKGLVHEDEFLVLALHNERAVKMPACEGALFCPFGVFRKHVLGPHMKGTFDKTCALTGWKYALRAWVVEGLNRLGIEQWPLTTSLLETA